MPVLLWLVFALQVLAATAMLNGLAKKPTGSALVFLVLFVGAAVVVAFAAVALG